MGWIQTQTLGRLLMGAPPEPDLDWAAVVDLARRHGVSPLLFWQLPPSPAPDLDTVPAWVRETIKRDFYAAAARSMIAERQLAQVLAALAAAGVPALVVKGAAAGAFYPNPALRTYGDLDVLVPQVQLAEAEATLNRLGYHAVKSKDWMLDHYHHLPPLVSADGRLTVEVHWRLDLDEQEGISNYAATLPVKDLWSRAVLWSVAGQAALRLEAVDAVLHLCRHTVVQHRAHLGLRPLCDLAQVVRNWGSGEWEDLARRASAYGLARLVYLMLVSAQELLGLAVPPKTVAALGPDEPFPDDLLDRLFGLGGQPSGRVPVTAVQAGAKGTLLARLRHFLWHLFLPRDGMAVVYNVPADSPSIWLTYLWRPIDLLQRYGKDTWDALRGDPVARAAWEREAWLERWLRG